MLIDVFPVVSSDSSGLTLPLEGVNREVVFSAVLYHKKIRTVCVFDPKKGPESHDTYFHRLERGVYLSNLNWDHQIRMWSEYEVVHSWNDTSNLGPFSSYGVADNLTQIKQQYDKFWSSDRTFALSLVTMRRNEQPEDGGWRWHKWGPYIGTKEPQCEYLHDEPEIKRAVCFSFYEVKRKA